MEPFRLHPFFGRPRHPGGLVAHPEGLWYRGLTPEAARGIVLAHLGSARPVATPERDPTAVQARPEVQPTALAQQAQQQQ